MNDLIMEYDNVLVEDLNKTQAIKFESLEVKLKPGSKVFFARRHRSQPLHWVDKIEKKTEKLCKAGIIERIPLDKQPK